MLKGILTTAPLYVKIKLMKKIVRKIPATMATQHPDHASRPFWHKEIFIPAAEEAKELLLSFNDFGISEYMWDWEGKLVDESILERLYGNNYNFFKELPLGKERFWLSRCPTPKVSTNFRLGAPPIAFLLRPSRAKKSVCTAR